MLPDEIDRVAAFVREQAAAVDVVVVTGGLGGTPDDVTRESIAAAFGVGQVEVADVAARLRARFTGDPEYAARWALLPEGSRPLEIPIGGAPGFVIENVYVLPGLPAEMEAMFETFADEMRGGQPIGSWRRTYRTTEGRIVAVLEEVTVRIPGCSSVRTRASTPVGAPRSRSCSSPLIRARWRPHGVDRAWLERVDLRLEPSARRGTVAGDSGRWAGGCRSASSHAQVPPIPGSRCASLVA